MNNKLLTPRFLLIAATIFLAAMARLIPHWPNFTPIAAIALFGGTFLEKKYLAFVVPLAAMLLSDIILGFHNTMVAVYVSFTIVVLIGILLGKKITPVTVMGASLASSVLFFLITNFGAWIGNPLYPQNFQGLIQSYIAGLAFFNDGKNGISFFLNEVTGTLFYNGLLFGIFYLVSSKIPAFAKER
jgi:hypothetical protein